jgi:hypothetical protein
LCLRGIDHDGIGLVKYPDCVLAHDEVRGLGLFGQNGGPVLVTLPMALLLFLLRVDNVCVL